MSDLDRRLSAVFCAAFSGLSAEAARGASRDSISGWDSVAVLTLSTLVEEEFGQRFDLEEAAGWSSYEEVRSALEVRLGG
jgi:acyl carrier protein